MARFAAIAAAAAMLIAGPAGAANGSALAIPALYKNCTNLNKRYPHGPGKLGGTPVTSFREVLEPRRAFRQVALEPPKRRPA